METSPAQMIYRRAVAIFSVLVATIVLCSPSYAANDLSEDESLKGVTGVMVIVERLHEDAQLIGLDRETVDAIVRDGLQKAGVKILSAEERSADERRPYLYINCNIMDLKNPKVVTFSIDIEVHQRVTLAGGEKTQALTWAKSYLGIQDYAGASAQIRHVLAGYIEQFATALKKANPEPAPQPKSGD